VCLSVCEREREKEYACVCLYDCADLEDMSHTYITQ
jgi:hypothetical protein